MQKKLSPWCKKAKIAMIQNDISVNDLAEELGCSRCYLSSTLNGKNTRATLDVLINEYGKTTLPYASKSGGEKVKASLAIILALSEIKATSAGIQLGMLFIDEPPFLDDDGTQAYVDALETIRQRYPDVKIMAITHDDAMKARFNQSVTVIKTEDGSKVIY